MRVIDRAGFESVNECCCGWAMGINELYSNDTHLRFHFHCKVYNAEVTRYGDIAAQLLDDGWKDRARDVIQCSSHK